MTGTRDQGRHDELVAKLDKLKQARRAFNPFNVLGTAAREETHSHVLAWLLDPTENHAIGMRFASALLSHIYDGESVAVPAGLEVRVEEPIDAGRIDILVLDRQTGFVWVIELKTYTQHHDDQLRRYREWCDRRFSRSDGWIEHRRVYLTPLGVTPLVESEIGYWLPVSYGAVLAAIDDVIGDAAIETQDFVRQYGESLRRRILNNDEIRNRSRNIAFHYSDELARVRDRQPDDERIVLDLITSAVRSDLRLKMRGVPEDREFSPRTWPSAKPNGPGTLKFRFNIDLYRSVGITLVAQANGDLEFTQKVTGLGNNYVPGGRRAGDTWTAWEPRLPFISDLLAALNEGALSDRFRESWREFVKASGDFERIVQDVDRAELFKGART